MNHVPPSIPSHATNGPDPARLWLDLFEEAPVAYHELDGSGLVLRVNRAHTELFGYAQQEIIGQPIWNFAVNDEVGISQASIHRKFAGEESLLPCRRRYATKHNGIVTVEVRSKFVLNQHGNRAGIRSALIDVTGEVEANARAEETFLWLRQVVDALPIGVIGLDLYDNVSVVNRCAARFLNCESSCAIGRSLHELMSIQAVRGGERGIATLRDLLRKAAGAKQHAQVRLTGRNGSEEDLCVSASPTNAGKFTTGITLELKPKSVVDSGRNQCVDLWTGLRQWAEQQS